MTNKSKAEQEINKTVAQAVGQEGSEQTEEMHGEKETGALMHEQKSTLQKLQEQKKVKIAIPKDPLNPKDKVAVVGINGVIFTIPRGKEFDVPESVAKVFRKSYDKTSEAYDRIKMTEMGEDDRQIEIRR